MTAVSVCIPTYNYGRYIGRAIESVLRQTHEDLELLVIDDCSQDETAAVASRYLGDPRMRFHVNEENIGLFANFNRCLEWARHDYVKVLCADDWLHPRSLADALAGVAASDSVALATSPGWLVDESGQVTGLFSAGFGTEVVPGARAIEALALWGNVIGMPSHVLMRRELALEVGGFEPAFEPASDVHLWVKMLAHHDLAWTNEPRCYLRVHRRKSHDYGPDPTEGVFRAWADLGRRELAAVDAQLLERALYREAREHLLYVVAHLLALRIGRARDLLGHVARHVQLRRVMLRFMRDLPWLAGGQLRRILARKRERLVIYDPAPRAGPPLREVVAP